ncbi:MAG: 16S rRNA (cytosine(1402)-N(4))-methyltransferase, partial [Candidatus Dadabacteria bacterium]
MPDQVVKFLKAESGGTFLDCTFGSGGHTRKILEANPVNRVVALDRDSEALKRGSRFLGDMKERLELKQLAFSEIGRELSNRNFNGILADLGLSTDQLKSGRGFSFSDDTPLDMRMDQSQQLSADDIVNTYSQSELERVLKEGGATHSARQLASAIVQSRPINNTSSLASIVRKVLAGKFPARKKIDPATVVFQAIRIAV